MENNPKYGPAAQTPEQRAYVLAQMQKAHPGLYKKVTAYVAQLYRRYVAGELSWQDVCKLRESSMQP
ncbi:hypothetical protein HMJ29_15515 [Hymenobacter taeanensis]|uniref:Uncharacterized protein n=1 Tax=Hymenobacter taeanensis TaxID=2735321 RepID=A0A6M6BK67_9BACT|nr:MULTISPECIES: hypothetical protein [Hymenobacter]QJX48258.1 hypothetical protein HMJ29_15515 [Hymenobacter taeanensis]UOQ82260.1 hypothetical protein MUN83_05680 [Hymenobacter sp. 5414T-23]